VKLQINLTYDQEEALFQEGHRTFQRKDPSRLHWSVDERRACILWAVMNRLPTF